MSNIDWSMLVTPETRAAEAGARKRAAVNAERERRVRAGATVTVPDHGDVPVQGGDPHDRNLTGLGMAALARVSSGDTETITTFRDADNADHDLTPPKILALWQGAAAHVEAIYQASWAIKADLPTGDVADDPRWP